MKRIILFLLCSTVLAGAQPKSLFYMTENPGSVKSFSDHADKVDILVPVWYSVDGNGLVWGGPNASVLKTAAERHVPVMPIVGHRGPNRPAQTLHHRGSEKRLRHLAARRVQEVLIQRFPD